MIYNITECAQKYCHTDSQANSHIDSHTDSHTDSHADSLTNSHTASSNDYADCYLQLTHF